MYYVDDNDGFFVSRNGPNCNQGGGAFGAVAYYTRLRKNAKPNILICRRIRGRWWGPASRTR